jgi:hypothetical protein
LTSFAGRWGNKIVHLTCDNGLFHFWNRACARAEMEVVTCGRRKCCYIAGGLPRRKRHFELPSKAIIAALLAGIVLLLDAMAACPSLHELIHRDANTSEHQCAVTLFTHGQVDSATLEISTVPQTFSFATAPLPIFFAAPVRCENLPPGRAPPVLPAVS